MKEQYACTLFQEGHPYHPAIHIGVDRVMVYGLNATLPERIDGWRQRGYKVALMTGLAWGAYDDYLDGDRDGIQHRALEVQLAGDGHPILHGDSKNIAYLVPTPSFQSYFIEKLLPVVDHGIDEFFFEEPEFWVDAGYSPAFKAAWEQKYSTPWQGQHAGPEAHWMAAKLKSELYLELFEQTAKALKEYGARKNREISCFIATHSLINYAQWRLVSPESGFLRSNYCDGMIGQVWTGTSRTPNVLRGKRETRTFFTSFLEYGYFAALLADGKRALWALHDPIEDNPEYAWPEYQYHYLRTVVASLLRPEIARFEICPWPWRIFSRAYAGEMIPEDYHVVLLTLFDALRRMGQYQAEWATEVVEVGLFVDDSALFQRPTAGLHAVKYDGTRPDSDFDAEIQRIVCWNEFFGLALPLMEQGIVVTPIPLKAALLHPNLLQKYGVIALSYQFMKPLDPAYHEVIANWVKNGGNLLYVGDGMDAFQHVREWWNDEGKSSRTALQDLKLQLGIELQDESDTSDLKVGNGTFSEWAVDPAALAEDGNLADEWIGKVKHALGVKRIQPSPWIVHRGPYVAGMNLDQKNHVLQGLYVDLTQGSLPVVTDPQLAAEEVFVFYDLNQTVDDNQVIAATMPMERMDGNQSSTSSVRYRINSLSDAPVVALFHLTKAPRDVVLKGFEDGSHQWHWHAEANMLHVRCAREAEEMEICIQLD
ncbi:hypothetical protein [Alicyclobacillus fodiniaquatilis]|uniref:Uncharacterized protein n=1 Tax=Alicyclobacillus fodiniaquatilis TaxID=1661150 RepID=A0ABW4JG29_9BACL